MCIKEKKKSKCTIIQYDVFKSCKSVFQIISYFIHPSLFTLHRKQSSVSLYWISDYPFLLFPLMYADLFCDN